MACRRMGVPACQRWESFRRRRSRPRLGAGRDEQVKCRIAWGDKSEWDSWDQCDLCVFTRVFFRRARPDSRRRTRTMFLGQRKC